MVVTAEITRDHCGIPCLTMSPAQHVPAKRGINSHNAGRVRLDNSGDLHVPQLADVEISSFWSCSPTQKDIARTLHQTLPSDDSSAIVLFAGPPGIRFEHRGARLLDLEKQGVVGC